MLVLGTGLQQSKALVAVVTTKYLNSKFCTNELYTASSDQKDIFPVILENIDFNASERARGVKYVIGSINWTLFGTGYDYGTALERLVQGMKRSGLGMCVIFLLACSEIMCSLTHTHKHALVFSLKSKAIDDV